jgi:hypothetical protein
MYVKIKKDNNKWVIFEVTSNILYETNQKLFNTLEELQAFQINYNATVLVDLIFPLNCFYIIYPEKNNIENLIIFNSDAYICNNDGKTIDSIKVK